MPCGYIGEFRNWKFENKNAFDGRNDYRPPEIIPRRIRIENLRNLLDTGAAFALLSASAKPGRQFLHRPTENPIYHVQSVRARIRARVQRLRNDDRGIRRREKIRRQIYFSALDGSRARLSEPEKN